METGTDPQAVSPLRVGIAGFGISGAVFHAPLIDSTSGLEVSAVVTTSDERKRAVNDTYPGARVVPSVDELWGGIDLLVIGAPNRFHAGLALQAVDKGIPVVVDKPLASSVSEAESILAAGGRVTVFQNRRWDGDFLTLRSILEDGRIGDCFRLESRFERFRPSVGEGWRESGDPADGAGQLFDLGAHLIDQAIELFGPPESVFAEIDQRRPGAQADDDVFVSLRHSGGRRSHLWMGKVAPLAGPRFRLSGLEGGIEIDGLDPQEDQLGSGKRPDDPGFGMRSPGSLVDPEGMRRPLPLFAGDYPAFYSGVIGWIRDGTKPPVDPADSLRVMRIIEAARASAASGEDLPLHEDGTILKSRK